MATCPKCGGRGFIPEYSYYANGRCFHCGGSGRVVKAVKNRDVKARDMAAALPGLSKTQTAELFTHVLTGGGEWSMPLTHKDAPAVQACGYYDLRIDGSTLYYSPKLERCDLDFSLLKEVA